MSLLKGKNVLIVEDETLVATHLVKQFKELGVQSTRIARREKEAVDIGCGEKIDLVLMDINLRDHEDGINIAQKMLKKKKLPVIFSTAYSDEYTIERAMKVAPYGYLVKPYKSPDLKAVSITALTRFELENRVSVLEDNLKAAAQLAKFFPIIVDFQKESLQLPVDDDFLKEMQLKPTMTFQDFISKLHEDDRQAVNRNLKAGKGFNCLVRLESPVDKKVIWLELSVKTQKIMDSSKQIGSMLDRTKDISKSADAELANVLMLELYDCVVLLDINQKIVRANLAFQKLIGRSEAQVIGKSIGCFLMDKRKDDLMNESSILENSKQEVALLARSGDNHPCLMSISEMPGLFEVAYVVIFSDLTQIKLRDKKLKQLAFLDQLTGCYNRNFLNSVFSENSHKERGQYSVIYIDIDAFKSINDTYGHDVGDEVIVEVAKRIRSSLRGKDYPIRVGGDEFVVLSIGSKDSVVSIANRIQSKFKDEISTTKVNLIITISIGIAIAKHEQETGVLLRNADAAMYEAKNNKTGSDIAIFDPKETGQIRLRLAIEQELKQAVKKKELDVFYQPIVDIEGKVVSAELLSRWLVNESGYISPDHFIDIAEKTNLIFDIGVTVFKEACIALRAIDATFGNDMTLSINVSKIQLTHHQFIPSIVATLKAFGLPSSRFTLEITESTLHSKQTKDVLLQLRELGFSLAIDDFGVGCTNLSELKLGHYDQVKLDRSLMPQDPDADGYEVISRAIADICHHLGKTITFEGVESVQQLKYAKKLGCHRFQGYFFNRPKRLCEFLTFLDQKHT